jgi:hypothetical protein
MNKKHFFPLVALFLPFSFLIAPARAALDTPVYAIANLSLNDGPPYNGYQFGVFDLGNPTGTIGTYQYAWTSLGSYSTTSLANLALNPITSALYLQYDFTEYRSIETDGTLGASSLGSMDTVWGMSFDSSANLYGAGYGNWYAFDSSTGATISSTASAGDLYSQFGGALTFAADGYFYFGNSFPDALFRINSSGSVTEVGEFSGEGYDGNDWIALFSSGAETFMLNSDRLYEVNLTDASLTRLGTITNLPEEFSLGFSGATAEAVPEPATVSLLVLFGAGALFMQWRRRRRLSHQEVA